MKLIYENYGVRYTVETDSQDHTAGELKEIFSKILVQSGFSPNVIEAEDGGSYQYVGDDEIVVRKELLEELETRAGVDFSAELIDGKVEAKCEVIEEKPKFRVLELFGGIGACSKALGRIGVDYEIADYVEIDKYAVASFNAIHGTDFEPQDICKWDKDIKVDLIMHGSPCQDFSIAGKQAGGDEGSGTRSSLMYETLRIVEKLKPKYVIWENVKNLISKKHAHNFNDYLFKMKELGYENFWKVLNAKDYGVPQNRERVFTISIRDDGEPISFDFPEPMPLETTLNDVLEPTVEEKYYLSDEQVASFMAQTERANAKGNGFKFAPIEREREGVLAHTIATRAGSRQTDNFIREEL